MDIVFYQLSKRQNSTKRPTSDGFAISGILNEDASIINPALSIKTGAEITKYNYAYIPDFGRFYKITAWEYVLGLWRCSMSADVLASYREQIGDIRAYILRSASQHDGNIIDGLYPTTPQIGILQSSEESPFNATDFIIHYVGKTGMRAALISKAAMVGLCSSLWSIWGSIDGMDDVTAAVSNPFQYVSNVQKTYAPVGFWGGQGAVSIVLGTVDTGAAGQDITDQQGFASIAMSVPKHPQSTDRPYLKASPYSIYSIRLPGIGWITLPSEPLYNASQITVNFYGEPASGNLRADILSGENVIASGAGKINTAWSLAAANSSPGIGGVLGNLAGAAGSGLLSALSNFIGAGSGIIDAAGAATATVQQSGGVSGCVGMEQAIVLQLKYQNAVVDNNEDHGRPLMAFRTIGDLKGFIQCEGAHFDGVCTQIEQSMIDDALNGGFFYE